MPCKVVVQGADLPEEEIDQYITRAEEKFHRMPNTITITVDGEFVNLDYDFGNIPFERIRRITGYLVGTLDRFNDGKRAEERDRVKHNMS
jgi:hypothetical protein